MYKIAVDAFGGDNAPGEIVEGALEALEKQKNIHIILCGDEAKINDVLNGRTNPRLSIVHAPDVISNNESPTEAIRKKENSSLVKAFDLLKNDDEVIALVSAGSTGAILTGAVMKIGRIRGISRPAVAPILPTKLDGKDVILIDSGANVDCKPINLEHFALMGSAYYSILYNTSRPRVALLSNGTEEHKGSELTKEAFPLLRDNSAINFIGNVEARELMSGDVDVMVCEGFAGNVLLKATEGAASAILSIMKKSIKSHFATKIGALFMKKTFKELKSKLDISKHGGSPFLGCKKLVIKNHGTSTRQNISASIDQAVLLHENRLIQKIENALEVSNGNS